MADESVKKGEETPEQKKPVELSEEDLERTAGGAFNAFVNFGEIKGESQDDKHKDWVSILRR